MKAVLLVGLLMTTLLPVASAGGSCDTLQSHDLVTYDTNCTTGQGSTCIAWVGVNWFYVTDPSNPGGPYACLPPGSACEWNDWCNDCVPPWGSPASPRCIGPCTPYCDLPMTVVFMVRDIAFCANDATFPVGYPQTVEELGDCVE